jgi:hypothetical protein
MNMYCVCTFFTYWLNTVKISYVEEMLKAFMLKIFISLVRSTYLLTEAYFFMFHQTVIIYFPTSLHHMLF